MPKSRVVKITNRKLADADRKLEPSEVKRSLSMAMVYMTGEKDAQSAWQSLFSGGDHVGIKPNCLGGKPLSSSEVIAMEIVSGLRSAGVEENNTIIWERTNRELKRAGYELNISSSGLRVFGTDSKGVGYGDSLHKQGKVGSLLSKIFEQYIVKNINFPLLKDHSIAGVSASMKNFFGLIHNPNKYHMNNCDPYLADLFSLPLVKRKNVLTICDATRIQYDGGPGFVPYYIVEPGTIMVAFDPVAMDAVGYSMLDDYRKRHDLKPLSQIGREPTWLKTAEKAKIGTADLDHIELIEETI